MKGQIHITEFDSMPFYMLHSIYYRYWLYTEEMKAQQEEEERRKRNAPPQGEGNQKLNMGRHTSSNYQMAMSQLMEDMEDEL